MKSIQKNSRVIFNLTKSKIRDLLPKTLQVPAKYYYNWLRGNLETELKILELLIGDSDRVIDVGGNRGIYAFKLWKLGAAVEVFEPNPICFNVLKAWAQKKRRINIHGVALSDHFGTAALHIPIDASGVEHDSSASIEHDGFFKTRDQLVDIKTLDSYAFSSVKLIKIDVEGHEYSVLKGAAATLQASTPVLLIEIEQRHCDKPISETFQLIADFGYKGYFMDDAGLNELEHFDVIRDQNFEIESERYINNFLFLHHSPLAAGTYTDLLSIRAI